MNPHTESKTSPGHATVPSNHALFAPLRDDFGLQERLLNLGNTYTKSNHGRMSHTVAVLLAWDLVDTRLYLMKSRARDRLTLVLNI